MFQGDCSKTVEEDAIQLLMIADLCLAITSARDNMFSIGSKAADKHHSLLLEH